MKKTIWQPLALGAVLGLLAGITTVTDLSFLIIDFVENVNTIGFFVTLFLLAAALGGPLAGAIASSLWVVISALYGPPEVKAVITIPEVFWSNLLAIGTTLALVGVAYRLIFERVKSLFRLLLWAGIVITFYLIALPASLVTQYLLLQNPVSEFLPAIRNAYTTYIPQAIFDIFFTSLALIALPRRYRRPVWYEVQPAAPPAQDKA
ncbi:MAG TPA: hypothetical protein VLA49_17855 [Anaerolineales bacterium]|nr:hypothetical protein [Anaerolineales bacterium]